MKFHRRQQPEFFLARRGEFIAALFWIRLNIALCDPFALKGEIQSTRRLDVKPMSVLIPNDATLILKIPKDEPSKFAA